MFEGYSGMLIFIGLLWLGHVNKPACFWVGIALLAIMASGRV